MNASLLIDNVQLLTPRGMDWGHIVVSNQRILSAGFGPTPEGIEARQRINGGGRTVMAGVIDTHVHFRDPGLTHKGDMYSESRAAVSGGVTSVIDMPNTIPATTTTAALQAKHRRAAEVSAVNYGFFLGATENNLDEIRRADPAMYAGIKIFMGSTTGNMLLADHQKLRTLLSEVSALFAVHAESNSVIEYNLQRLGREHPEGLPVSLHPQIRSRRACFQAARTIVDMAREAGARLHVLHLSTADELALYDAAYPRITFETCPQYLLFSSEDYARRGTRIKCNPAIKKTADREALRHAVCDGRISTIATDHAPHLPDEKCGDALTAASGMPSVQFALPLMLTLADSGVLSHERVCSAMTQQPAEIFGIKDRGELRPGAYADIVMLEQGRYTISDGNVTSLCGWTPYAGMEVTRRVAATWVNGHLAYTNVDGVMSDAHAMPLEYKHN